jgi:AraC family transcriptional regulator of arabinose operon
MLISWDKCTLVVGEMALRTYCQRGWHLDENWSRQLPDMDLWYVCSGRGQMQLRDRTITLRTGTCIWMRPGGRYVATQDLQHRLVVNAIHFNLLDQSAQPCDLDRLGVPEIFHVSDASYFDTATNHLIDLVSSRKDTDRDEHLSDLEPILLRAILMDLLRQPKQKQLTGTALHHQENILQAASLIRENLSAKRSITELARTCHYSEAHFSRTFKIMMGVSPQQYRIQQRVREAGKLLLESSYSLGQIADLLGYRDVYFFSRQFKQKMGVSPKRYRDTKH